MEAYLLEPVARKRKAASSFLFREAMGEDLEGLKAQLLGVRRRARERWRDLVGQFLEASRARGARVFRAPGVEEVVSYLREVAGEGVLSINKSNVIVNELRSFLEAAGFQVVLRYFSEFDFEGFSKEIEDYWSLPGLHERGVVESFEVSRRLSLRDGAERDYTALLSVNVAAASGEVFFLQHMSNIGRDLQEAQRVVLLVTPEKVVATAEDALLQGRAVGIFGLESVLLDLAPKEGPFDFSALPAPSAPREVHVVLYDGGREEVFSGPYGDLYLCIDCRGCARQCPIGLTVMRDMVYSPKNYLFAFLKGIIGSVEECLHCGRCALECPVGIDLPYLLWRAQIEHYQRRGRGLKKRLLDDPELLAKVGCLMAPVANLALRTPLLRRVMEAAAGIHPEAPMPTFSGETFQRWLRGRGG